MSKKQLNSVFGLLILTSFALTFFAFFVWNDPRSFDLQAGHPMTKIYIDKCELGEKRHKVQIKGWAYTQDQPYGRFQIYGQLENGHYRKFETFSRVRKDVVSKLGLDHTYERIGFEARYRGLSSPYTGMLMIRMETPQGEVFSANHQCS